MRPGLNCLQEHDGLVKRHRLGRPAFLALGHVDQARHIAADLVPGLGLTDSPLQDLVDQSERPRAQLLGAFVQPVIEMVGRQLLQLCVTELRNHMMTRERSVVVDGSFGSNPSVPSPDNR